ncbi:MAG: hypothetical protein JSS81_00065 [Acidobacteria bacterium]|nr:hypothetical protein [Acidobacteriota bacterium]
MKRILTEQSGKQTLRGRARRAACIFLVFQALAISVAAGSMFFAASEKNVFGLMNPAVAGCPDLSDNYPIDTCVRAAGATDIEVGTVATFYFETYVESGIFFSSDSYTVTTFNPALAKVSTNPNGPFTDTVTIPLTRSAAGYARSPNIYVKGIAAGANTLWAYTTINNDGNTLNINIRSAPAPGSAASSLFSYISELPVGWTSNIKIKVTNGTPNTNDIFHVGTTNASAFLYAATPTGAFSAALDVPIRIGADGTGETAYFFVKGLTAGNGLAPVPQITACGAALPCIAPFSMRVFNVASVRFETYANSSMSSPNVALDNNPSAQGGGLRIYPENKTPLETPADSLRRQYVTVVARLGEALAGKIIRFRVFDVDDPSTDDPALDPNGADGRDNRSGNYYFYDSGTDTSRSR